MPISLKNLFKIIFTRTIVFYLVCFLLIWRMMNYHDFINNAAPQTLSRLTLPIDYFTEFVDKEDHYDRFNLMNCINYHQAVAHFYPVQRSEAYGMLGFCYERLGKSQEAITSYTQAIAINPYYFWPYYNLGVIYYNQTQYSRAIDYFQQAIEQNPVRTIVLLSRSKVYNDVKLSKLDGSYDYYQGLKQGRTEAYILMMNTLYKAGRYEQLGKTAINGVKENLDAQGIFYYYAGVAAFYLKSYEKAVEFLQIALQNDPRNSDALLYLGMCLKVAGKEDMAQVLIKKAALMQSQGINIIGPYLKPRVRFF